MQVQLLYYVAIGLVLILGIMYFLRQYRIYKALMRALESVPRIEAKLTQLIRLMTEEQAE